MKLNTVFFSHILFSSIGIILLLYLYYFTCNERGTQVSNILALLYDTFFPYLILVLMHILTKLLKTAKIPFTNAETNTVDTFFNEDKHQKKAYYKNIKNNKMNNIMSLKRVSSL